MAVSIPENAVVSFEELAFAARELVAIRLTQHGPLDMDDPLDAAIDRLLRSVEELEADTG